MTFYDPVDYFVSLGPDWDSGITGRSKRTSLAQLIVDTGCQLGGSSVCSQTPASVLQGAVMLPHMMVGLQEESSKR